MSYYAFEHGFLSQLLPVLHTLPGELPFAAPDGLIA